MNVNRDLAAAFLAHPQDTFLSAMTTLRDVIAERDALRAQNERLLNLNFGFMEQNRKLREERVKRVEELRAAVESAYCAVKPDGCDCGTDEPGTCALCLIEALREKGWAS